MHLVNPAAGAPPARKSSAGFLVLMVLVGLLVGAGVATGIAVVTSLFADDSRSRLTLSDLSLSDRAGFGASAPPGSDACEDRFGCVEAVEGDGVSIYRCATLDLARQAVIYNDDTDFYRSDRLVLEFDEEFPAEERFWMLQSVEGTWTMSES